MIGLVKWTRKNTTLSEQFHKSIEKSQKEAGIWHKVINTTSHWPSSKWPWLPAITNNIKYERCNITILVFSCYQITKFVWLRKQYYNASEHPALSLEVTFINQNLSLLKLFKPLYFGGFTDNSWGRLL